VPDRLVKAPLLHAAATLVLLLAARPVAAQCAADCNGDAVVTVNELITAVTIALGTAPVERCAAADANGNGAVTVDELIAGVRQALSGCGELVTVRGTCLLPGGPTLVGCATGTAVRLYRCDNPNTCLDGTNRTQLSSGAVGTAGAFELVVDARATGTAPLIFEAELPGALVYRVIDIGAAGTAGAGQAGGVALPTDVVIDPSSEGAARGLAAAGLDRVAGDDLAALVEQTRLEAARDDAYADLDAAQAADAGQRIAFDVLFIDASAIAVSPDGANVYVVDAGRDALAVFARDPGSGSWENTQIVRDGVEGADGLDGASGVAVSSDGRRVFVASRDEVALGVFARAGDGRVSFVEAERFGPSIEDPVDVTVSPDDRHVYTASFFGPLGAFAVDPTGLRAVSPSGVNDAGETVVASPDGRHLYAADVATIIVAARDEQRGTLEVVQRTPALADDLVFESLTLSPDGAHLYALASQIEVFEIPFAAPVRGAGAGLSTFDSLVTVYRRDADSGALTLLESVRDGLAGTRAVRNVESIAASPDGAHVYVGAPSDGSVVVFARAGDGSLSLIEQRGSGGEALPFQQIGAARALALVPDGSELLVASDADGGIAVSTRDSQSGELDAPRIARAVLLRRVALAGPAAVALPPDGAEVLVASPILDAVAVFARDSDSGALVPRTTLRQGMGDADGLVGATDLAFSPDGQHLYVVGQIVDGDFIVGSTVAAYARTGDDLSLIEVERDGRGGVILGIADAIAISPDGADLYVTGTDGVSHFSRDERSGRLTFEALRATSEQAGRAAVSPDGAHVYVLHESAVLVFGRAPSGALGFIEERSADPKPLLDGTADLALTPDGLHLYVVAAQGPAVVVFNRDPGDGRLAQAATLVDAPDLGRPRAVAISPDGRHVYVVSDTDDAVVVFARDALTGLLSRGGAARNGENGINGLGGAHRLRVSPDGRHVYVASQQDEALVAFARDSASGLLTFIGALR
jgi:6-phosphogluconolactonase (cycloisomerase 2 family)